MRRFSVILLCLFISLIIVFLVGCFEVNGGVKNSSSNHMTISSAKAVDKSPTVTLPVEPDVKLTEMEPAEADEETVVPDEAQENSSGEAEEQAKNKEPVKQYELIEIDINKTYLYDEMLNDIERLQKAYPELIETEVIGKSLDNRAIFLLKLGKGERKSLMLGGVHAREIAATPLLMKMVNEYAKHYYTGVVMDGFNIKELLDQVTLYIVPAVNPDGMEIAVHKEAAIRDKVLREALKSIPGKYVEWKANARGVDLNRNFTCTTWGKVLPGKKKSNQISTKPSAEFYGGPHPASEPETQAIENLIRANDFKILFDVHSKGRVIYWYKEVQGQEFNDINYKLAKAVSEVTGYEILSKSLSSYGQGTDGNTTDFAAENGIYCLTIETVPFNTPFPMPVEAIINEWDRVKHLGLVLARETAALEVAEESQSKKTCPCKSR